MIFNEICTSDDYDVECRVRGVRKGISTNLSSGKKFEIKNIENWYFEYGSKSVS